MVQHNYLYRGARSIQFFLFLVLFHYLKWRIWVSRAPDPTADLLCLAASSLDSKVTFSLLYCHFILYHE